MPITITVDEDGGDPDANSYGAEVDADAYHAQRGNVYWNLLDAEQRKSCLIRATDFIDKRFGPKFRGFRIQKDQVLAWPRLSAFDDDGYSLDGIPTRLKRATFEYALRAAIYNVLAPDPTRPVPSQDMGAEVPNSTSTDIKVGPVRRLTEKVGPLEKTVEYDNRSQPQDSRTVQSNLVSDFFIPQYPEADLIMESLLVVGGSIALELA